MLDLKGIFPPLPTSFDESENLAPKKIQDNIKELNRFDLAGFLVLGSNGELVHLNEKEKLEVYAAAREIIPENKLMLTGTGGQTTRETINLTKFAAEFGADAALVLNPFYYKGLMTEASLISHYFSIADAAEIPIIVYNMPANSGLDMESNIIQKISEHENIIGLKDSGGNVTKLGAIIANTKDDFQVIAGSAGFLLPALSIGAVGGILALANIAPQECIDILTHFQHNNCSNAKSVQLKINELNTAITRKYGVPALKFAMNYLGLYGGEARKPLLPITDEIKSEIIRLIQKSELKKFTEQK